ncbi:sigma-54 dependent transcriptional regulator [Ponticaulis sp.]|uniref:sigma 54-interacting transcriptional regulator n=1 Tax=Ponticaulis sp. TaxID=2020902 RepID=UPI000B6DE18B|nr:sigma-54 dependent transcriptional regulator [Ponticaulis sp.]MAI89405.1 nitrogen regulation protein NR(I) [Ponticaulis sp.]OUY00444.1 MAG: nitrogen regulation protein NR(I) [Hyphomonadaceae bacterium TMED5]|tara:strand:- start:49441 stop:50865 length:1425 start_codon:yes stop_codon:yes gene_type:complete
MGQATILLADDDAGIRLIASQTLIAEGHAVRSTTNPTALMRWVRNGDGDLLITDVYMGDECIFDLMPDIRAERPDLPIIVISGQSTLMTAMSATEHGAFDYLPKPFDIDDLAQMTKRALQSKEGQKKLDRPLRVTDTRLNEAVIGRSAAMQEVFRTMSRVKNTALTILIEGESGTGKETIARAIHDLGNRQSKPFVPVNMAAVERDRIEAELFGVVMPDGSVTPGKVAQSDGGTLFLDEVGDMPLDAQTQLLRFLQNGEFSPVGSNKVDVSTTRVIAATSRDLRALIEEGSFRNDLFYRLNVVTIAIPPLRARKDDIPELAKRFLKRAEVDGLGQKTIDSKALKRLSLHDWPGNVRELQNVVLRMIALSSEPIISEDLVQTSLVSERRLPKENGVSFEQKLRDLLREHVEPELRTYTEAEGTVYHDVISMVERPLIELALNVTGGNKVRAAQLLGMNRNTLRSKINSLEIASPD